MTDERIIAYLLGELPEDDLERFEDECFAQESWPAQIELVEEDLVDAYLRDELTPERRQRFERSYQTTPARQERVRMAAALLRHIDECNASSMPAVSISSTELTWGERFSALWNSLSWGLRAATAIGLVAVIAGTFWLSFRTQSPRTYVALTLSISSNNRADGAQVDHVKLPPNTEALNIALRLPQQLQSGSRYRVELENDNGETKSARIAGTDAQSVQVVIPAAQLNRGLYALKLFVVGTGDVEERINGSYFFMVE